MQNFKNVLFVATFATLNQISVADVAILQTFLKQETMPSLKINL